VFVNLFSGLDSRFSFRDHNFSNFLERLEQVKYEALEAQLAESWTRWGPGCKFDPNEFNETLELTLSRATCTSFIRTNPSLPVGDRDYYLSKLCQFIRWTSFRRSPASLARPAFPPLRSILLSRRFPFQRDAFA